MTNSLTFLYVFIFLVSIVGVFSVKKLALRYGWVATPRKDRWHKRATALHGGIGFFPAITVGYLAILFTRYDNDWSQLLLAQTDPTGFKKMVALGCGALLIFFLGWVDDIKNLKPATKFIVQLIAASFFILAGGIFHLTHIALIDIIISFFWFVGIINAVNMLDNMDGLSSGVVIISSVTLVVLSLNSGSKIPVSVPLGIIFCIALFGFWLFNRHPAKIFMGDSGSLFIGYILGALSVPSELNGFFGIIRTEQMVSSILGLLIPVTVIAIPIFDTTLVTVTRKWRAQKASQGGRDHSSHRLVVLGFSEKRSVQILYGLAIFGGIVAFLLQQIPNLAVLLLMSFVLVLVLSGVYLGHVKIKEVSDNEVKASWTPVVSYLLYKRRAAEVLMDLLLISSCYYTAYLLRFDWQLTPEVLQALIRSIPIVIPACLLSFFTFGIYRYQWRLISFSDISNYIKGVLGGIVLSITMVTLFHRFEVGQSRNIYLIFGLLLFIAIVGVRASFRYFDQVSSRQRGKRKVNGNYSVIIYGAGKAGKLLAEELIYNPELQPYNLLGFIDDDSHKDGSQLGGVLIRTPEKWIKKPSNNSFEIWISSKFIDKDKAVRISHQFPQIPKIKRMMLSVKPEIL